MTDLLQSGSLQTLSGLAEVCECERTCTHTHRHTLTPVFIRKHKSCHLAFKALANMAFKSFLSRPVCTPHTNTHTHVLTSSHCSIESIYKRLHTNRHVPWCSRLTLCLPFPPASPSHVGVTFLYSSVFYYPILTDTHFFRHNFFKTRL